MTFIPILKEIIDAFKNWLRDQQPELIPIPVKPDPSNKRKNHPGNRFNTVIPLLVLASILLPISDFQKKKENATSQDQPKTILFLGDSITAGYGLDQSQAFPAIIQQRINSAKLNYTVVNAGLSGETSSGGLRRVNWLLRSKVDILVLELGANDGLRGIDLAVTRSNLQQIIDRTRQANSDVIIVVAGMQVPPNLGQTYTDQFRQIFPELAKQNNAKLIPFILDGVAGVPNLNLSDGIHPNVAGHKVLADNVWSVLRPILK
jgi:acyl-CoA thioesterase I